MFFRIVEVELAHEENSPAWVSVSGQIVLQTLFVFFCSIHVPCFMFCLCFMLSFRLHTLGSCLYSTNHNSIRDKTAVIDLSEGKFGSIR